MANSVYDSEDITLENYETEETISLNLRLVPVARQRKVMDAWEELQKVEWPDEKEIEAVTESDDEDVEKALNDKIKAARSAEQRVFLKAVGIALEPKLRKHVIDGNGDEKKLFNAQGELTREYREFLEEWLDDATIRHVLSVCAGITLPDPKALQQMILDRQMEDQVVESGTV